ncbi:MAG: 16S rRNA (adenine(1518)-N(6)/adenine(1519)-N(6))-dimethyltransferase RsmA [Gammaproteobacteria bacterium]|nr:16S rRNA (adenine(1518)-N(6)/adenine(1519)-N(6))-dimethyltransferase RsmA [Gammaproteobacteria bacterium]
MRTRQPYGQHFLVDDTVIERILDVFGVVPGERIIEIGPGRGALTEPLLRAGMFVDAIEIDPKMIRALETLAQRYPGLTIHHTDALQLDLADFATAERPARLIGNLPYQISTPLLLHLSAQITRIRQMTFMLQREVVARLDAAPGSKDWGRLGIALQCDWDIDYQFDVPAAAFAPPPRVVSSVLTLWRHPDRYQIIDRPGFVELVRLAFQQRRKTLRNALAGRIDQAGFERANIDPSRRAEQLSITEFVRLANLKGS